MNMNSTTEAFSEAGPPPPYAYVPVDPFKPSLAFSLNNILPLRRSQRSSGQEVRRPSSVHRQTDHPQRLTHASVYPNPDLQYRNSPVQAGYRYPRDEVVLAGYSRPQPRQAQGRTTVVPTPQLGRSGREIGGSRRHGRTRSRYRRGAEESRLQTPRSPESIGHKINDSGSHHSRSIEGGREEKDASRSPPRVLFLRHAHPITAVTTAQPQSSRSRSRSPRSVRSDDFYSPVISPSRPPSPPHYLASLDSAGRTSVSLPQDQPLEHLSYIPLPVVVHQSSLPVTSQPPVVIQRPFQPQTSIILQQPQPPLQPQLVALPQERHYVQTSEESDDDFEIDETSFVDQKDGSTAQLSRACQRCKNLKVRCDRKIEREPCIRCSNGGYECIIPGRKIHGGPQPPEPATHSQLSRPISDSRDVPFLRPLSPERPIEPIEPLPPVRKKRNFKALASPETVSHTARPSSAESRHRRSPILDSIPGPQRSPIYRPRSHSRSLTRSPPISPRISPSPLCSRSRSSSPARRYSPRRSSPLFIIHHSRTPSTFHARRRRSPSSRERHIPTPSPSPSIPSHRGVLRRSRSPAAYRIRQHQRCHSFTRTASLSPRRGRSRVPRPARRLVEETLPAGSTPQPSIEHPPPPVVISVRPAIALEDHSARYVFENDVDWTQASTANSKRLPSPNVLPLQASVDNPNLPDAEEQHSTQAYLCAFLLDTVPRQIYLYMLLCIPHLYFSRVTRIFEEAEMSLPMIKQGILDAARAKDEMGYDTRMAMGVGGWTEDGKYRTGMTSQSHLPLEYWEPHVKNVTAYENLQNTWDGFIDSLQKEWKTLNIISVLLLSAILTILQIPSAAADPLTRYSALLSMICALMSLLYGCVYIIRFGTMRKTYKGAAWAEEAQRTRMGIFWNVWVLLAMPATWLAWSMILYIVTIMSFVWRTTPVSQPNAISESSTQILIPRIIISLVLALGVVYFILIAATLRRYGEMMDRAWQKRIWGWMRDGIVAGTGRQKGDVESGLGQSYDEKARGSDDYGGTPEPEYAPQYQAKQPYPPNRAKNYDNQKTLDRGGLGLGRETSPPRAAVDVKSNTLYTDVNEPRDSTVLGTDAGPAPLSSFVATNVSDTRVSPSNPGPAMSIPTRSLLMWRREEVGNAVGETRDMEREVKAVTNPMSTAESAKPIPPEQTKSGGDLFKTRPLLGQVAESEPSNLGSRVKNSDNSEEIHVKSQTKMVRLCGLTPPNPFADSTLALDLIGSGFNIQELCADEWDRFKKEILVAVSALPSKAASIESFSALAPILENFNTELRSRNINRQVALCQEFGESEPECAIYYSMSGALPVPCEDISGGMRIRRYASIPNGLQRLDIIVFDANAKTGTRTISLFSRRVGRSGENS